MRTTLDLDEDVLHSAKELAMLNGSTTGKVLSDLARRALTANTPAVRTRNGVPLLRRQPAGSPRLTMTRVNELRDEG